LSWPSLHTRLRELEGQLAPSLSAIAWVDGKEAFVHQPAKVYDLASLTKVLSTTEVAFRMAHAGVLDLDAGHPLLPPGVTPGMCLSHTGGFQWWRDLAADVTRTGQPVTRANVVRAAREAPLVTAPGTAHTYSDLGFIALGAVLEEVGGARIDGLWRGPLSWGHAAAESTGGERGVVNDDNARVMGGVAPHAGLFGNARQVLAVAVRWLRGEVPVPEGAFSRRGGGSHALGWDTPSGEMSSAGPRPPPDAIGHTGFTGTSLWMSPSRRAAVAILTNRVAYGRDPAAIRAARHELHQLAWDAIEAGPA
jgi:CubicO group peptidase (beta-lactamase class C family)